MQRRQFLQSTCNACLLAGAGVLLGNLSSCTPSAHVIKAAIVNNTVSIPVTGFSTSALQFVTPEGWLFDIAVRKKEDQSYEALLMQCTHQRNQLVPTPKGFTCNLHGSIFGPDGNVLKGPAEFPLKQYQTTITNDQLTIHLV